MQPALLHGLLIPLVATALLPIGVSLWSQDGSPEASSMYVCSPIQTPPASRPYLSSIDRRWARVEGLSVAHPTIVRDPSR